MKGTGNFKFRMRIGQGHYREKCKIRSKGFLKGSCDLLLKFCDPPLYISGTAKARNYKLGVQIDRKG